MSGKHLFLLFTGTGLVLFVSIVHYRATYQKFGQIILIHGVRQKDQLVYHDLAGC